MDSEIMNIKIRRIKPGDEAIVSCIQIESWKSAFAGILSQEELNQHTDYGNVKSMYENVLKKNLVQGWILMLEKILDEMSVAGYKKAMLWVFTENIRARRFYEKHGFCVSDKTKQLGNALEVMYYKIL